MRRLVITEFETDITSYAGLGLIGMALTQQTNLAADTLKVSPLRRNGMPHADMLSSYIALLCLGKSDFEAITPFREDVYFAEALDIEQVPSEGVLRQRMDAHAALYRGLVEEAAINFLRRSDAQFTPFDNSDSKREGGSRTYKGPRPGKHRSTTSSALCRHRAHHRQAVSVLGNDQNS